MPLLVAACTNRKRIEPRQDLCGRTLPPGPLEAVSAEWLRRAAAATPAAEAATLYCGRSVVEVLTAARSLGAGIAFLSTGLGVVRAEAAVPSYSLTVSGQGPDAVLGRIVPGCGAADWWSRLERASPVGADLADLARANGRLVVCALPEAYLEMAASSLVRLAESGLAELRIVTGTRREAVPPGLLPWLMPYDARLDGPDSPVPGTRADFAARAARHFAECVLAEDPQGDARRHADRVEAILRAWRSPIGRAGRRRSDEELLALLRAHWDAAGGRSTRLLRVLRDDLGVACEQGRLAGLVRRLRREGRGEAAAA